MWLAHPIRCVNALIKVDGREAALIDGSRLFWDVQPLWTQSGRWNLSQH